MQDNEWVKKVVKYDELDKGFVLRAGSAEIAKKIKQILKHGIKIDESTLVPDEEMEDELIPEVIIPDDETEE